jgi:hypothetical protein
MGLMSAIEPFEFVVETIFRLANRTVLVGHARGALPKDWPIQVQLFTAGEPAGRFLIHREHPERATHPGLAVSTQDPFPFDDPHGNTTLMLKATLVPPEYTS